MKADFGGSTSSFTIRVQLKEFAISERVDMVGALLRNLITEQDKSQLHPDFKKELLAWGRWLVEELEGE